MAPRLPQGNPDLDTIVRQFARDINSAKPIRPLMLPKGFRATVDDPETYLPPEPRVQSLGRRIATGLLAGLSSLLPIAGYAGLAAALDGAFTHSAAAATPVPASSYSAVSSFHPGADIHVATAEPATGPWLPGKGPHAVTVEGVASSTQTSSSYSSTTSVPSQLILYGSADEGERINLPSDLRAMVASGGPPLPLAYQVPGLTPKGRIAYSTIARALRSANTASAHGASTIDLETRLGDGRYVALASARNQPGVINDLTPLVSAVAGMCGIDLFTGSRVPHLTPGRANEYEDVRHSSVAAAIAWGAPVEAFEDLYQDAVSANPVHLSRAEAAQVIGWFNQVFVGAYTNRGTGKTERYAAADVADWFDREARPSTARYGPGGADPVTRELVFDAGVPTMKMTFSERSQGVFTPDQGGRYADPMTGQHYDVALAHLSTEDGLTTSYGVDIRVKEGRMQPQEVDAWNNLKRLAYERFAPRYSSLRIDLRTGQVTTTITNTTTVAGLAVPQPQNTPPTAQLYLQGHQQLSTVQPITIATGLEGVVNDAETPGQLRVRWDLVQDQMRVGGVDWQSAGAQGATSINWPDELSSGSYEVVLRVQDPQGAEGIAYGVVTLGQAGPLVVAQPAPGNNAPKLAIVYNCDQSGFLWRYPGTNETVPVTYDGLLRSGAVSPERLRDMQQAFHVTGSDSRVIAYPGTGQMVLPAQRNTDHTDVDVFFVGTDADSQPLSLTGVMLAQMHILGTRGLIEVDHQVPHYVIPAASVPSYLSLELGLDPGADVSIWAFPDRELTHPYFQQQVSHPIPVLGSLFPGADRIFRYTDTENVGVGMPYICAGTAYDPMGARGNASNKLNVIPNQVVYEDAQITLLDVMLGAYLARFLPGPGGIHVPGHHHPGGNGGNSGITGGQSDGNVFGGQ